MSYVNDHLHDNALRKPFGFLAVVVIWFSTALLVGLLTLANGAVSSASMNLNAPL